MSDRQPLKRFTAGRFSVALRENEVDDGQGGTRPFQTVTASAHYHDRRDNEWKWARLTMKPNEVDQVIGLLQRLHDDGDEPEPDVMETEGEVQEETQY